MKGHILILTVALLAPLAIEGCGSGGTAQDQQCTVSYPLTVTPLAATLDHMSVGTANQVQFRGIAYAVSVPASCPQRTDLEALEYATWSNPDSADIQISSAYDASNGLASCINATAGAVTITGTFMPVKVGSGIVGAPDGLTHIVNVTLTCK